MVRAAIDGIVRTRRLDRPTQLRDPRRQRRWRWIMLSGIVAVSIVISWLVSFGWIVRELAPFWRSGRYLVLLQNDAELRPSGGFIGTYAVVTIRDRQLPTVRFETNIYKVDNAFTATHSIAPPTPLQGIVDRWALRDSNWAIDFPEAARTVADFYHQETGETVDGVIGVTAHAGQSLVALLGSVPLADGTRLTADTFYSTLNYQVEKGYFLSETNRKENEPKIIIAQLVRTVGVRLLLPWHTLRLPAWLSDQLATKFMIASFFDAKRAAAVAERGWDDAVNRVSLHYLALNNANIAGLKSSRFMSQTVTLEISDTEPGSATYQLQLTRTHYGTGIWPDHRNDNLTRIVVPAGAIFTAATLDGVPVEPMVTESTVNRSVVGFRIDTDPGASRTFAATIRVPIDPTLEPSFTWQKQPGVIADTVFVSYNGHQLINGLIDRDRTVSLPVVK